MASLPISIRLAEPNDLDGGLWCLINSFGNLPLDLPKEDQLKLFEGVQTDSSFVWVAVNGVNRVVGTIKLFIELKLHHHGAGVGHIEDVIVSELCRGKGVGRALLEHALSFAKDQSLYKIVLECKESLVNFYGPLGFVKEGASMSIRL